MRGARSNDTRSWKDEVFGATPKTERQKRAVSGKTRSPEKQKAAPEARRG
jgi:hypothetical protein